MDKKDIRKEAKFNREKNKNKKREADCKIYDSLIKLSEYQKADKIFIYLDFNNEVETRKIIEHALKEKKKVYIPRVEGKEMVAVSIKNLDNLIESKFKILEPIGEAEEIDKETVMIIPGVAFSENGERVGYGGGYYDRFLENKNNKLIALAYECQIYKELPVEEHDIKIPTIITEERIIINNVK